MAGKAPWKKHVVLAIDSVKAHIDQNPCDGKTTSELALFASIGRNALQTAFKHVYGITIREYKSQQRMKLATQLLEEGKMIKAISHELRYTSQSAFTTAFKNHFGMTPTDWLKKQG